MKKTKKNHWTLSIMLTVWNLENYVGSQNCSEHIINGVSIKQNVKSLWKMWFFNNKKLHGDKEKINKTK